MKKLAFASLIVAFVAAASFAQAKPKFTYAAQKKLIPADLGEVYLGMPLKDFAAKIDISKAEADDRFDWLELQIPFVKGNITSLAVRVHGLSEREKAAMIQTVTIKKRGDNGDEYEADIKQLKAGAELSKGFVYSMYIAFKPDFDLKKYLDGLYGKGSERAADDPYHIYDTQWVKTTTDGLVTLVRAFHKDEKKSLQLLGRIAGTEWDPGV
jgi:hypothetical protein